MVDDTYYITPHEAALAVVATSMKKSRLPFYILCINSVIGAFLFSAGGMLYVMCEAGSRDLIPGAQIFVFLAQGAVYAIGLFYVIVCGMELFNSNILFFSVGVMRGAVTLMDLIISWFVSFWINLAATVFVVYVICYLSGVLKQENYVWGTNSIAESKNSFTFAENLIKGIAGNFFVCLAVYLQIMVKPLHVKFLMIFLPIFTFVAMGFSHVVADMFLVPAAIFNGCGYGFGHYFWKMMLPGAVGNMIGGSFFGIVIPWYLHLYVIESDMKKLNLPAYEERDEQPMLNMDSRVVRVPTHVSNSSTTNSTPSSIKEFKPDDENDISRVVSTKSNFSTSFSPNLSRYGTSPASIRSRNSNKQIRSPKGVFPVVDMGAPLMKEKTIAAPYLTTDDNDRYSNLVSVLHEDSRPTNNFNPNVNSNNDRGDNGSYGSSASSSSSDDSDSIDEDNQINVYSENNAIYQHGSNAHTENEDEDSRNDEYLENPYDPDEEKVGSKLLRAISRTVIRNAPKDLETGEANINNGTGDVESFTLAKAITRTATRIEHDLESKLAPPPPTKSKTTSKSQLQSQPQPQPQPQIETQYQAQPPQQNANKLTGNKLFRQFTFGGGGNDNDEIRRRLANAKITRKAAGMSNDIAGIHVATVDKDLHRQSISGKSSKSSRKKSSTSIKAPVINDSRLGGPYASDRWKHFTYDYELDEERPVSFISERSKEHESDNEDENNSNNKKDREKDTKQSASKAW